MSRISSGAAQRRLGHWPTALEYLPGLSSSLGGPRILIKRDDCTGLATGGNKTRKLEFLVAEALAEHADTLITIGAIQSNHSRQTAAAAAILGLRCEIIAVDRVPISSEEYRQSGNRLLTELFGATIHPVARDADPESELRELAEYLRASGKSPYVISFGGSSAIGALGYARAAGELLEQFDQQSLDVDLIIHASGSGGTQAGLLAGLRARGSSIPVLGVSIVEDAIALADKVSELARQVAPLMGSSTTIPDAEIQLTGDYVGDGYGVPTPECLDAINRVASSDGILLDPVYTGKAMAALIDLIQQGKCSPKQTVVFLHTGGVPALFSYISDLRHAAQ